MKQYLVIPVLFFCFSSVRAQINVNTSVTLTQLVNNIVGPGNTVSNVTLNCPSGSYATFTNGNTTNVGISQGVLLTTGNATDVNGPGTNFASVDNLNGSDPLLDGLTPGTTFNTCRIEFDIMPSCSTLQMQYVFGSEEYPEFVGSTYNDVFGFFISGPNPAGPAYNNSNIAIIPSTTTAVAINNVNSGSYSQYYVDNQFGSSIVYDGFTTPLTAYVNVIPCQTYHMVLAIADVGDPIYDSGVFLSYNGLQCPSALVTASSDVTICAGGSTTLTANLAATNPVYTWTPATGLNVTTGSSVIASPTITTSYIVTAVSGCNTSTDTVVVTVGGSTVNITPQAATTCGNPVTLTASGASTYTWSPATGLNVTTGATVNASPATTTVYTVTGTTGTCTATATATVTIGNPLTVSAGPNDTVCLGSTYQMNVTGGPVGSTYAWSPSTGLSNASIASPVFNGAVTTTYTVLVTEPGGCTGSDTITIVVAPNPTLATAGFPPSCAGGCNGQVVVIPANGTQPYSMTWNTGCTTASCNNLCPGTYSVTITDAMGCQVMGTATVNPAPAIVITLTSTPSTCGQPDGTICAQVSGGNPGYTYSWNTTPAQTGSCANNLVPGVYCVTVTDINGCTATQCDTVLNTPGITPSICATTPPSCSTSCDATATVCVNGGSTPYNYSWSNGQTGATATGLCPGNYTVNVTDANGCAGTATVTITAPSAVTVTPSANVTICIGQNTSLTATGAGGTGAGYTYDWTTPAFTGQSYTVSPQVTTVYSVIAYDANLCPSAPATVTVTVNQPLNVVAAGATTVCPGGSATLTANGSGGDGTYTYTWLPAGTGSGTPVNVTLNNTTTYTVVITDGCTLLPDSDVVTVTVAPLPVVNFAADTISGCYPVCVDFTDLSTSVNGTITAWSWSFPGANTTSSNVQNPIDICYSTPGSYGVTLIATNNAGCTSTLNIANMITVYDYPDAEFVFGPQPATLLDPEICFTDQSVGAVTWQWDFADPADLGYNYTQNPCHIYSDTGTFYVELTVTNIYGCEDSSIHTIVISPDFTFWIPNAFTPNDDGNNDSFNGKGIFITEYEMWIFDRWGNLIFYTDDLDKGWDGHARQGKDVAQEDVYVYMVKLKDIFDKEHKYRGHVTLIK
jgi:gliding motility-associated-like protein